MKTLFNLVILRYFFLSGKYWVDPNRGCAWDAFEAECRFVKESGYTCLKSEPNKVCFSDSVIGKFPVSCGSFICIVIMKFFKF